MKQTIAASAWVIRSLERASWSLQESTDLLAEIFAMANDLNRKAIVPLTCRNKELDSSMDAIYWMLNSVAYIVFIAEESCLRFAQMFRPLFSAAHTGLVSPAATAAQLTADFSGRNIGESPEMVLQKARQGTSAELQELADGHTSFCFLCTSLDDLNQVETIYTALTTIVLRLSVEEAADGSWTMQLLTETEL